MRVTGCRHAIRSFSEGWLQACQPNPPFGGEGRWSLSGVEGGSLAGVEGWSLSGVEGRSLSEVEVLEAIMLI